VATDLLFGRRILVVEDDMFIRLTLEDMLAELGCQSVSSAATIEQALALIDTEKLDAATLDVNLSGTSSYPVADSLAARDIPFVFSTGYGEGGLRDGYRERPLLKKPFGYQELADALARLIS
jgi:CheY-like chemotaxis protein